MGDKNMLIEMIKSIDPKLTDGEIIFISNKIRNEIRRIDDPCMDNFRFCKGIKRSKIYLEQMNNGCCGYTDIEIKLNNNKHFHFGFNYGH